MKPRLHSAWIVAIGVLSMLGGTGCGRQAVEPGQRGLRYSPHDGGVKPEVLQPGSYSLGWCVFRDCGYIETYDVTYQTRKESVFTPSSEGLAMDVNVVVTYRPVTSELFQLHTEIGKDYYEEIIGPEFRSAARNVLARHSYTTLVGNLDKVEDEIEEEVRRRIRNKHVEVSSITLEKIKYASPEIANAVEKRLIGQQEAARQKAAIEAQAARDKTALELAAAQAKLKAESDAQQARLQNEIATEKSKRESELALAHAKNQKEVLQQQIAIDKLEAEQRVIRARAVTQERTILASANAAENRADESAHTSYTVQAAGYEALGKLGGHGTTIFLGDWSRAPNFLWPRQYQGGPPTTTPIAPAKLVIPTNLSTTSTSTLSTSGTGGDLPHLADATARPFF
jgi:regulator of protease activity HflC (stomatin/prohibitin superfamily)